MGWVGNNSWIHPPFFWRHLVPQNVGNIICGCYFLNIVFVIFTILSQIQNGTSLRKKQFRDYFIRNRLEKLVPLNWNFAPQNLKKPKKTDQLVFKPWLMADFLMADFLMEIDFLMENRFSMRRSIFHENSWRPRERPTNPWEFVEAAGAADKKCGGVWGVPLGHFAFHVI